MLVTGADKNRFLVHQAKFTLQCLFFACHSMMGPFIFLANCTFQNCNKRLKNNVMFMYHIWAHVAQQKPAENEEQYTNLQILLAEHNGDEDEAKTDDQRTDVSRLHACPECLLEQPTPYRARLHYHRPFFRIKRTKSVPGHIEN
ncbi:hypothetical protein GPALN_015637 [Globodera pallida]|nr:hypothetical protein GPALN_015637 [Globodera pallida]